ncbi:MAG: hypothetical protein WBA62_17210 [Xanthobacteraceae bacterium]
MSNRSLRRLAEKITSRKPQASRPSRRNVLFGITTTAIATSAPQLFKPTYAAAAPTIFDQVKQYTDMLTTGQFPIPPWAGTLGVHVPDVSGVPRDDDNIICQPETSDTSAPDTFAPMHTAHGLMDGGDSAARTGVAAFCNSKQDMELLPRFEKNGFMVRHPKHFPWNNPKNCTRDQLLAFLSGCWRARKLTISQSLLTTHAARGYVCQNIERDKPGTTKSPPVGDILLPDDIMYLHICAGDEKMFMEPFGQLALQVAIQVADRSAHTDKTNLMLECIVCGRLNLFVQVHQNYKEMLRWYFLEDRGANRQLGRIAEELIFVVDQELKRYPSSNVPLLPTATLDFLRKVDLRAELKNMNAKNHLDLAAKFAQANLKDAATTFVGPMKLSLEVATTRLQGLGASASTIARGFADAKKKPADISKALGDAGITAPDIQQAIQIAFPHSAPINPIGTSIIPHPPIPLPPSPPPPPNPFHIKKF